MDKRVLVISASMGEGHDGAARELVRRLRARGHEAAMVDFLDAPPLKIGPLTRIAYGFQLRRAPWSYELTYRIWSILPFLCRGITAFVTALTGRRHLRWIEEYRPDVVVTTYPLTSLVLGRLRQKGRITVPAVTFVTDFAVHPLWVHRGVDLNLCVHPQAAEVAARRTGRPSRAPGPMVADAFRTEPPDRAAVRAELGLGPDDRAVLVVAGSWGVGDIDRTFDILAASGRYTPIAVCGRNEELRASLAARTGGRVLGWTDRMPALMAASDALVQNAGGLTCMEAFAVGLPVVTCLPIPGHGKENAMEMERAGVAAYARTPDDLLPVLERVTTLAGRAQAGAGKAMFAGDAADEVIGLLQPEAVPVAAAVPHRSVRRAVVAVAASLLALWSALTIGVETAAAHGIGVARPAPNAQEVYVGVRLGPSAVSDPSLAKELAGAGVTAIVDGSLAASDPAGLRRLGQAGVDVANGGWGGRHARPWSRARADLMRACRAIRAADGDGSCRSFVPGRRVDGFDLASARLSHQRVVATSTRLAPGSPPIRMTAGHVYVLDARSMSAADVARSLELLRPVLAADHLRLATLSRMH